MTSMLSRCLSFSLCLRFPLELEELEEVEECAAAVVECLRSSGWSSASSFVRFLDGWEARWVVSFCFGGGRSASGDLDALVEAEGAERRPERRISRGERGGPMVAAWAMA